MKLKYNELIFDMNGDVNLDNYYTKSECDNKYALKSHSHNISDITNLQSQLNSKAASNHTHSQYATTSAVTNAQNTANNALNVANSKSSFNISTRNYETLNLTNSFTPKFRCFCLLKNSGDSTVTITQNGYNVFAYEFNQNYPDTFVPLEAKITTLSAHSSGRYCAL